MALKGSYNAHFYKMSLSMYVKV